MENKKILSCFTVNKEVVMGDTRFTRVTIDVMHTGLNLNGNYFDKEVVEKNIDSIRNTPILGFINHNADDFEGHKTEFIDTPDGVVENCNANAYGVVPESCNPRWVTKMTVDGEKEFMQVDGILWEKFNDAVSIFNRDVEKNQSMELQLSSVDGHEDEHGVFYYTDFKFNGCCILGDSPEIQPAMAGSTIKVDTVLNTVNNDESNNDEGGNATMSKSEIALEQFETVSKSVAEHETYTDKLGNESARFFMLDADEDGIVVIDGSDNYCLCSIPYAVVDNKAVLDFEGVSKIDDPKGIKGMFNKYMTDNLSLCFEKIESLTKQVNEANNLKEGIETQYCKLKEEYEAIRPKYDEYVKAEQESLAAELKAQKDEMFSRFDNSLSDNPDYIALKADADNLDVGEIEQKCSLMYTRKVMETPKPKDDGKVAYTASVKVVEDVEKDSDFANTKYGMVRKNRR